MNRINVVNALLSTEPPKEFPLQYLQAKMCKDPDNNVIPLIILNAAAKQVMNLDLHDFEKKILNWLKKTNTGPVSIMQLSTFYQDINPEVKQLYVLPSGFAPESYRTYVHHD